MPGDHDMIKEIYRLTKENNAILHRMRRNAFWGGLLKFIIYAIIFAAPIWFYMTYLNGTVEQLINALDKAEGTTQSAQVQFSSFEQAWKDFEAKLPAFLQPSQSSQATTTSQ